MHQINEKLRGDAQMYKEQAIIFENEIFKLVLSSDCVAESLILKSNGEECIYEADKMPFFSLTEDRPYNNEIKLAHPNKRTTFQANRVRIEDGRLIVGFELIDFEAIVDVRVADRYMVFTLVDFIVNPKSFGIGVLPILPPVAEFRLVQLPIAPRERFGEWLNVLWDDKVAVNVLSACPYPRIASDARKNYRILYGEALREVKLKGAGVALIVSEPGALLTAIDALERDYDLPHGVESRRSPLINRSYYRANRITPLTVDEHIRLAKLGGFKFMCIYYPYVLKEIGGYRNCGEYRFYRDEYPNGRDDLVLMLEKIKAAGIIPGLHILHTHIGLRTRYLTPVADHRLNLVSRFTLSRAHSATDTTIYVEENPEGSPIYEKHRILRFMGELIQYESYTTEPPYCFTGCTRGFNDTLSRDFEIGTPGGILDVSEFAGNSAYIDQRTGLQDEIAEEIANLYDAGFEFLYFDGSEGTNPPFDINVGLAQWRVYKRLKKEPIFCEGAAKSHFSWHMISGGNAFDAWRADVFKEMMVKHPFAEAPHMANDFTRLNFGWWIYTKGQRVDIYEYGTALAAACDCPGAFEASLDVLQNHPRALDMLETFRRWELARECGFVTDEIKAELKKTEIEHTLLINESGELELAAYEQVKGNLDGDSAVTAFVFERGGKSYAVMWHNTGCGRLAVSNISGEVSYVSELGGEEIPTERDGDALKLSVDGKRYLITEMKIAELKEALEKSILLESVDKI